MRVNEDLLWDYDFTEKDFETDDFRRWYVARVLTNGTFQDVHDIGLPTIRQYLPQLWLPAAIQEYWEWYFEIPHANPTRPDPYTFPQRAA